MLFSQSLNLPPKRYAHLGSLLVGRREGDALDLTGGGHGGEARLQGPQRVRGWEAAPAERGRGSLPARIMRTGRQRGSAQAACWRLGAGGVLLAGALGAELGAAADLSHQRRGLDQRGPASASAYRWETGPRRDGPSSWLPPQDRADRSVVRGLAPWLQSGAMAAVRGHRGDNLPSPGLRPSAHSHASWLGSPSMLDRGCINSRLG